jgi:uncharacterized protein
MNHDPEYLYGNGERPKNAPRGGDWMQTFTGRQFWPLDPRPEEVFIEDIAHALSNMCRFGGHVQKFYSVAQHSVLCARNVLSMADKRYLKAHDDLELLTILEAAALMHDATEAYLVDVPRPIKRDLTNYAKIERRLAIVIGQRFDLPLNHLDIDVHRADENALATERRDLRGPDAADWCIVGTAWPERIVPWSPKKAERLFLAAAKQLGIK